MSRGGKTSDSFVDTGLLRDHVSKLHRERKIAYELYENVSMLKSISDPTISYQYNSILRDIAQLIEYFNKMADVLSHVSDDAVQLSYELGELIENDTENIHRITSNTYML